MDEKFDLEVVRLYDDTSTFCLMVCSHKDALDIKSGKLYVKSAVGARVAKSIQECRPIIIEVVCQGNVGDERLIVWYDRLHAKYKGTLLSELKDRRPEYQLKLDVAIETCDRLKAQVKESKQSRADLLQSYYVKIQTLKRTLGYGKSVDRIGVNAKIKVLKDEMKPLYERSLAEREYEDASMTKRDMMSRLQEDLPAEFELYYVYSVSIMVDGRFKPVYVGMGHKDRFYRSKQLNDQRASKIVTAPYIKKVSAEQRAIKRFLRDCKNAGIEVNSDVFYCCKKREDALLAEQRTIDFIGIDKLLNVRPSIAKPDTSRKLPPTLPTNVGAKWRKVCVIPA